jgi:AraC-like DNA-binding protein
MSQSETSLSNQDRVKSPEVPVTAEPNHGFPRATGAMARLAFLRAKIAGIELKPLLESAHLNQAEMEDPEVRLRVRDQIDFLNVVADAIRDDCLGFHLAQVPDLREFGLLYYVMASAETLGESLRRTARYSSIFNEGIVPSCVQGKSLSISLRYAGVQRHADRHQVEFFFAALIRICRKLTGLHLLPTSVRMVHHRSFRCPDFPEFFGDNLQFDQNVDEITFPARIGSLPIISADPYLNKILVAYCEEAISKKHGPRGSFRFNVENAIVPLLPHGKARTSEVARRLGVGQRTFARRLSAEGLNFSAVLGDLRVNLANRYLADRQLSISQIAWLLGYQEVGSFSHAFRRWTGKTPREVRAEVAGSVPRTS